MVRSTVTKVLSGSYVWEVLVESPVEDGLLWLQGLLAPAGIWLCERQGEVAVRAAQSLTSAETVGQSLEITDADILGHPTVLWYDPAVPYAYNRYALRTNDEDDSDDSVLACTTLPPRDELLVDVTDRVFANEEQVRLDMLRRCDDYAHYPGEVITLSLRGAWWGLCPGDVIDLTT